MNTLTRGWFAFLETEQVVSLGAHATFNGASDAADKLAQNVVWIFDADGLRALRASIDAATLAA